MRFNMEDLIFDMDLDEQSLNQSNNQQSNQQSSRQREEWELSPPRTETSQFNDEELDYSALSRHQPIQQALSRAVSLPHQPVIQRRAITSLSDWCSQSNKQGSRKQSLVDINDFGRRSRSHSINQTINDSIQSLIDPSTLLTIELDDNSVDQSLDQPIEQLSAHSVDGGEQSVDDSMHFLTQPPRLRASSLPMNYTMNQSMTPLSNQSNSRATNPAVNHHANRANLPPKRPTKLPRAPRSSVIEPTNNQTHRSSNQASSQRAMPIQFQDCIFDMEL